VTALSMLAVVSRVDFATFVICAIIVVVGAVGVVASRNPVHAALMLVMTLFGVAVLFIEQQANFLAAVQVIVYAGAIVVLFLFVIMFLGVDRRENLAEEPLRGQRLIAPLLVAGALALVLLLGVGAHWAVGPHSVVAPARGQPGGDVAALGRAVFTDYLWPFEITAGLLVIAVVGAVVLARRPRGPRGDVEGGRGADGSGEPTAEGPFAEVPAVEATAVDVAAGQSLSAEVSADRGAQVGAGRDAEARGEEAAP
jgi:NADH-quinone oxidoreductase subunit J